jgi:hypothetical protein
VVFFVRALVRMLTFVKVVCLVTMAIGYLTTFVVSSRGGALYTITSHCYNEVPLCFCHAFLFCLF